MFNTPIISAADLTEQVQQLQRNLSKAPPSGNGGFGQRLKEAVRRRLGAYGHIQANTSAAAADESFGAKLSRAVQARLLAAHATTVKQHRDQAEKNKSRYRRVTRCKPTKGE
jgi:hypothetical protein